MNNGFNINFAKHAKKYICIALALIVVSFGAMLFRGLDFGIDFRGGTIITIELNQKFDADEIRDITNKYDSRAEITTAGDEGTQVVISTSKSLNNEQRNILFGEFEKKYNLDNKDLLSIDNVDGVIGNELKSMAVKACIIAVICMLVYITLRFEFLQGVCSVFCLMHDIIIVIGVFAAFQIQINSSFIAALLTILGYSINSTIVTFDRLRENTAKVKPGDYATLTNMSINQTIKRSINTSLTTILAITPLLLLGTTSIKEFVFPMIVGFIAGTFSSVCVAAPLWYLIRERQKLKDPKSIHRPVKKQPKPINQDLMDADFQNSEYAYNQNYEQITYEEKSEDELLKEKEEKKARRKARKERKKGRKKGQR